MSQDPWNEEAVETEEVETASRRGRSQQRDVNSLIFTILGVVFLVILILITILAIYLSNSGNKQDATTGFYNSSNASSIESSIAKSSTSKESSTVVEVTDSSSSSTESSSSSTEASSSSTTESSALVDGAEGTITVQPGEGAGAIAARAGISMAELEQLNPEHMTTGAWYANPGDVVRIK